MRIFAAVLVGITHSYAITGNALLEPVHIVTGGRYYLSSIGLYIFFFTSGYLVTASAMNSKSLAAFLKKRVLRIYPALIVVVLLSVFVAGPLLTTFSVKNYFTDADTWKYLWTASGIRIRFRLPGVFERTGFAIGGFNGSLWSISLELQLYGLLLLLMLTGIFKRKKVLIITFITLIIVCFLMSGTAKYTTLMPDQKSLLLACAFLFGGIVQTKIISKKIAIYLFIASGLLMIVKLTALIKVNILMDEVIFFSLATYFIAFTNWFTIRIKNDISYGVYIYTFPIQQFFFQISGFNQSVLTNLLLSLFCSGILALLSWKYIEKPALRYKTQFS
ncbi:MAG: acyltransferase [Ginsengibacter sp.]